MAQCALVLEPRSAAKRTVVGQANCKSTTEQGGTLSPRSLKIRTEPHVEQSSFTMEHVVSSPPSAPVATVFVFSQALTVPVDGASVDRATPQNLMKRSIFVKSAPRAAADMPPTT